MSEPMKTVLQAVFAAVSGLAVGCAIGCARGHDFRTLWSPPTYQEVKAEPSTHHRMNNHQASMPKLEEYPWFESQTELEERHARLAEHGPQGNNSHDPSKGWMVK